MRSSIPLIVFFPSCSCLRQSEDPDADIRNYSLAKANGPDCLASMERPRGRSTLPHLITIQLLVFVESALSPESDVGFTTENPE